jgi:hypothetical protein
MIDVANGNRWLSVNNRPRRLGLAAALARAANVNLLSGSF